MSLNFQDIIRDVYNPKTHALQMDSSGAVAKTLLDVVGLITYVGKSKPGSNMGDPVWQIKKIDESSDPEMITLWADGNDDFDNIWDDRTSLTYS